MPPKQTTEQRNCRERNFYLLFPSFLFLALLAFAFGFRFLRGHNTTP